MKNSLWVVIGLAVVAAFLMKLYWKPQPVPKRGGDMEYHVTKHGGNQQDFSTFNQAIGAIGNVVDETDVYDFVFDGDQAAEAQPYSLAIGEDGQGWFTDYSGDNPAVTHFSGASAMDEAKAHVRDIDKLARGIS